MVKSWLIKVHLEKSDTIQKNKHPSLNNRSNRDKHTLWKNQEKFLHCSF